MVYIFSRELTEQTMGHPCPWAKGLDGKFAVKVRGNLYVRDGGAVYAVVPEWCHKTPEWNYRGMWND